MGKDSTCYCPGYYDQQQHIGARAVLRGMVVANVFTKQLENAKTREEVGSVMRRIYPFFITGLKNSQLMTSTLVKSPLGLHLKAMSNSDFKSQKAAMMAWKNLAGSRWCRN